MAWFWYNFRYLLYVTERFFLFSFVDIGLIPRLDEYVGNVITPTNSLDVC